MVQRYTVAMEMLFPETIEMKETTKHLSQIITGSYSNTW